MQSFTVETQLAPLAVTIRDGSVVRIELNTRARRSAETSLERLVSRELEEYAAGERTHFTFAIAPEGTDFDRRVWRAVQAIPYGRTKTYGQIAAGIGKPGAARAVGTANGRNPVPPVIPCHRVVAAGGKLGGYGGGLPLKRRLLDMETLRGAEAGGGILAVCLSFLLLSLIMAAAACTAPERPLFFPDSLAVDTFPPVIEFLSPPEADSIRPPGSTILVQVRVSDASPIRFIAAGVLGEFTFGFPSEEPLDTVAFAGYSISVPPGTNGRILLRIVATDTLQNRASADRPFVIR